MEPTRRPTYSPHNEPSRAQRGTLGETIMDAAPYLRRQAAFYLRLSEFCSDGHLADQLRSQAADFHQRALRAEFNLRPVQVVSSLH
jgi:hypothetical protein